MKRINNRVIIENKKRKSREKPTGKGELKGSRHK
jgi:hypothetical protein